jgi:hypothetical protein
MEMKTAVRSSVVRKLLDWLKAKVEQLWLNRKQYPWSVLQPNFGQFGLENEYGIWNMESPFTSPASSKQLSGCKSGPNHWWAKLERVKKIEWGSESMRWNFRDLSEFGCERRTLIHGWNADTVRWREERYSLSQFIRNNEQKVDSIVS